MLLWRHLLATLSYKALVLADDGCSKKDMPGIVNAEGKTSGSWRCQTKAGESIDLENDEQVPNKAKCFASCGKHEPSGDDYYIMRPGVSRSIRCRDGNWELKESHTREKIPVRDIVCERGCHKSLLPQFDNGGWSCPLEFEGTNIVANNLDCFATCNLGFTEVGAKRSLFHYKDYRKTCKCNTENGRCHWRLNMEEHEDESDIVPMCEFSKTNRIINGQDAIANSKRYMVSVQTRPKKRAPAHHCGGVLIHPNWVLTAAHCKKKNLYAVLGEHDLTYQSNRERACKVIMTVPHPQYHGISHDVMMMKIKCNNKGMGQYIEPAILPSFMHDLEPGSKCEVCGWGNTNSKPGEYTEAQSLKCVELPIISTQRCNAPNSYAGAIHEDIMCVGYMTGGQDSCQGDSGGPAICNGRVHGLVMGGNQCAQANFPGVYTRLSHYIPWIRSILEEPAHKKAGRKAGRSRRH